MEEGGVEFGHSSARSGSSHLFSRPPYSFPETAAREPAGVGQRQHVFGRAGELQHPLADPRFQRRAPVPRARFVVSVGRKRRDLLDDEEIQVDVADLLSHHKVVSKAVEIRQQDNTAARATCPSK